MLTADPPWRRSSDWVERVPPNRLVLLSWRRRWILPGQTAHAKKVGERVSPHWATAESARGVSPRAAHRTGLETLASSGSCHSTKTAVFRRYQSAPPVSRWPVVLSASDPPPSLHPHYRGFIATTGQSAPVRRVGTFGLMVLPLVPFPFASTGRFSSSIR